MGGNSHTGSLAKISAKQEGSYIKMKITVDVFKPIITEREISIAFMAATMVVATNHSALAYTPGLIKAKAAPIIQMITELADPAAYGVYTWACIRFILNQKPEAKEMAKNAAWGYMGVKLAPTVMGLFSDMGS
jgi:hypothetical protein